MSKKSEYDTLMETQLKKWDADVDALAAKGEQANEDARAAYRAQVKELRANRDSTNKTFQDMRNATEEAGEKMQAGMQSAWDAMKAALEKASDKLTK